MPFQKIEPEKLPPSLLHQITRLILPNDCVSRPSQREAVAKLHETGLLTAKPNTGVFNDIDFCRDMEGLAAERTDQHGSAVDLEVIDTLFRKMAAAYQKRDRADEAALYASFHMAIIKASHNIVMLHMMRSMYDLLRQGVFYNRHIMLKNRLARDMLLPQHRGLNAAIQTRDTQAARAAVELHLD